MYSSYEWPSILPTPMHCDVYNKHCNENQMLTSMVGEKRDH